VALPSQQKDALISSLRASSRWLRLFASFFLTPPTYLRPSLLPFSGSHCMSLSSPYCCMAIVHKFLAPSQPPHFTKSLGCHRLSVLAGADEYGTVVQRAGPGARLAQVWILFLMLSTFEILSTWFNLLSLHILTCKLEINNTGLLWEFLWLSSQSLLIA
jgi:hypothetical protein